MRQLTLEDPVEATVSLASTSRIMEDSAGKFRIRTGVWNYEEAVIDVSRESEATAATAAAMFRALGNGPTRLADHVDPGLLPVERANLAKLILDLEQAGVLAPVDELNLQDAVTAALLGRLTTPYPAAPGIAERPIAFVTDSPAAQSHAEQLASSMGVTLIALEPEVIEELSTADLTSRVDGYDTERAVHRLREAISHVAVVVTCMQRPSLAMLRNLNRVVEGHDKPWVNAFIDGPFVSVVGLKSPHTGCFECFEQRALARLEDHVAYHEFARSPVGTPSALDSDAPLMSLVTVLSMTEGYLHAAVGTSRMSGRVLGIHLPTLEIQTQDLLRMPNCPACGRVARQRLKEINFNSRAAVDRITSEVLR